MLNHLTYINNVGRFETVALKESLPLQPLTLIYSENGRGKTTLCSILRSLTTGDPVSILERRRLSAKTAPHVTIAAGAANISFDGKAWNAPGPRILVFDEHFVDTNIYSGLSVTPGNRQNTHELVIGEEGIKLNRHVQELTGTIADLQSDLKEAERDLPVNIRGGLSVDAFCELQLPDELKAKLDAARKTVSVLRDAESIRNTAVFEPLTLPIVETEATVALLSATLPNIEASALAAVAEHLTALALSPGATKWILGEKEGKVGHAAGWVSEGMVLAEDAAACPFCGLPLDGSTLIAHYQAYFSNAYRDHKQAIATARESIQKTLDGDRLARFQRGAQDLHTRHAFWSRYIELPAFGVDTETIASAWLGVRAALLKVIDLKLAAPLEKISLPPEASKAIEQYQTAAALVKEFSSLLLEKNTAIAVAKEQAGHGNLATAQAQVAQLETIEKRHEPDIVLKCTSYMAKKFLKLSLEAKKDEARQLLNDHRKKVFINYQTTINAFLLTFNADFRIEALKPSDARGVTSSDYELLINQTRVGLAAPKDSVEPSFRTGLSAGDRNTLALAFFFTTLGEEKALQDTIVVLDDPVSSLDDGRSLSTSQEIRGLVGRAAQLVVLSHSRSLLIQLWERADKAQTATLQIRNALPGPDMSTIEPWNAEASAISEYDRLHKLVRDFATSGAGSAQTVAPALRMLLESFLRVAFVEYFLPGKLLGDFLQKAKQLAQAATPILTDASYKELDKLREYANQFHHDENKALTLPAESVSLSSL